MTGEEVGPAGGAAGTNSSALELGFTLSFYDDGVSFVDSSRPRTKGRTSDRDGLSLAAADPFLERDRDVPPDLNRQHDSCGKKKGADRDVHDRRNNHRQLRLRRIRPPHHARDKGQETETELTHHQTKHEHGGTPDCFEMRIHGNGPDGR